MEKVTTNMLMMETVQAMQQATALDHCLANIALQCHVMALAPCLGLRILLGATDVKIASRTTLYLPASNACRPSCLCSLAGLLKAVELQN